MQITRKDLLFFTLTALLIYVVHSPSLTGGFIWDDILFFQQNPLKISPGSGIIRYYFTNTYFASPGIPLSEGGYYRPLANIIYHSLSMLTAGSTYLLHLFNYFFHYLNGILFFFLLKIKLKSKNAPYAAVLIFSVHPAFHQAVDYITGMIDLLALTCCLSVILCLNSSLSGSKNCRGFFVLSLLFYFTGSLIKENVFFIPAAAVLLSIENRSFSFREIIRLLFPYTLILLLLIIWRHNIGASVVSFSVILSIHDYFIHIFYLISDNICRFFLPFNTTFMETYLFFDYPRDFNFFITTVSALILLLLSLKWRKSRLWGFSFLLLYFPVSNIIPIHENMLSIGFFRGDHLMYIPGIALSTMFALYICRVEKKILLQYLKVSVFIAILLLYLYKCRENASYWGNSEKLYLKVIEDNPSSKGAYTNLGIYYFQKNDYEKSLKYFMLLDEMLKSYNRNEKMALSRNYGNSAYVLLRMGKYNKAAAMFEKSLSYYPENQLARQGLKEVQQLTFEQ